MVVKTIPAIVPPPPPFFFIVTIYFSFGATWCSVLGCNIYNIKNNNSEKYFKSYKIPTQTQR
jgi:hypothetical protein